MIYQFWNLTQFQIPFSYNSKIADFETAKALGCFYFLYYRNILKSKPILYENIPNSFSVFLVQMFNYLEFYHQVEFWKHKFAV